MKYIITTLVILNTLLSIAQAVDGEITAPSNIPEQKFGTSISIDSNLIAISAPGIKRVYLYRMENTGPVLIQTIHYLTEYTSTRFGESISLFNGTLVIGDPGYNSEHGAVFIYEYSSFLNEYELKKIIQAPTNRYQYGISVALLSRDTLFIGMGKYNSINTDGTYYGYVYGYCKYVSVNEYPEWNHRATSASGYSNPRTISISKNKKSILTYQKINTGTGTSATTTINGTSYLFPQNQSTIQLGTMISSSHSENSLAYKYGYSLIYDDKITIQYMNSSYILDSVNTDVVYNKIDNSDMNDNFIAYTVYSSTTTNNKIRLRIKQINRMSFYGITTYNTINSIDISQAQDNTEFGSETRIALSNEILLVSSPLINVNTNSNVGKVFYKYMPIVKEIANINNVCYNNQVNVYAYTSNTETINWQKYDPTFNAFQDLVDNGNYSGTNQNNLLINSNETTIGIYRTKATRGGISIYTDTFKITKNEINPQIFTTNNYIFYLNSNGEVHIQSHDIIDSITSECNITDTILSNEIFDCTNIGLNTLNVLVKNENDNQNSVQINIIIIDTISPLLICPVATNLYISDPITQTHIVNNNEIDIQEITENCNYTMTNNINHTNTLNNSYLPNGNYEITWTITDESNNQSECTFNITVSTSTLTPSLKSQELKVFPNPFSDYLKIDGQIESYELYEINGVKISEGKKNIINTSDLMPGVYFLKIVKNNKTYNYKLTK